ncbi:MAG: DinB family protein [Candidatus Eiseniibacteriota bacterium]
MAPEFRAYMRKIDGYRAGRAPLPLMKTGPTKITRAVAGLKPSQLRKRPAPGKWSIAEILGHLVDTEVVYGYRYRMALSEPGRQTQAYDQSTWTTELRHRRRSVPKMLDQIRFLRGVNLDLVESVPRSAWKRYGMHTERGKETVRRTLELIAGHDLNHLHQILTIKKKYGW